MISNASETNLIDFNNSNSLENDNRNEKNENENEENDNLNPPDLHDSTPEWLTQQFFEDIFRWHFNDDNLKITQLQISNLATKGISFSSILHRAVFVYEKESGIKENFQVIIKAHPKGETGIIAHKNKLFHREILVYTNIIPKIHELLLSINDFNTQISPKCYYTTTNPESILLLEDMKINNNYQMFERKRLLNLESILLVIKKLAILHGTTALIHKQYPDIMKFFREGPISSNPDRQDFLGFFPANIKSLAKQVNQWLGYEDIAKKLFQLEKTILPKAIKMFEENQGKSFEVLNLGDLWINNLIFKFKCNDVKNEPEDVILYDYQLSYFGSPAIDLNYLIYGSLNENVRRVHYRFIIKEYHRYLKEILEKLNYPSNEIPSLKDIHIQIIQKSLHAVIASVCLTPFIFMETNDTDNLDGLFDASEKGDKFREKNIQNPKYKTFIQKTLVDFELSGFLD